MSSESAAFHCWYCHNVSQAREKGRYLLDKFEAHFRGPIVDLGCGEGAMLLVLKEKGRTDLLGIESNPDLAGLAESWGVPVVRKDVAEFIRGELKPATYTYIDVIEHLPFDLNVDVFKSIPAGSRLILQTPYTDSLLGHQSYMNVPSHLAPYSPMVIRQMLAGLSYEIVAEGSVDGRHPDGWKKKLRGAFVKRVLGLPVELITGGANYFVVADRKERLNED